MNLESGRIVKYCPSSPLKIEPKKISNAAPMLSTDVSVIDMSYICVIIDLYSRMVVGYKIGKTNSTQLVKSTFQMAYKARQPDSSLVFHTDRGGNYRSKTMNDYMRSLHITHSFSRAHVPYDNSVMESFFASLKREELYRTKYRSEADFQSAVDKYIVFYNTKRPHKKLQYKTPEQKEEEYALKDAGL